MRSVFVLLVMVLVISFGGVVSAQQEAVDAYNQGLEALNQGRLDEAVNLFSKAIEIDPVDHYAYNNRGVVFKRKGEYENAIRDYTRALEIKPDYLAAKVNRGIARYRKGDFDLALDDLESVASKKRKMPLFLPHSV